MDFTDMECQKRLIKTFVNSVFLYDDEIKVTFNYSSDHNTVTLEQINDGEHGVDGFVCCAPCSTKTRTSEPYGSDVFLRSKALRE